MAITGRYPDWDTRGGTTVYQQPFTSNNTVWVEIDHEFPLGMVCVEIYGSDVRVSRYKGFDYRMLLGFSYFRHGHGWRTTKLFAVSRGRYLPQYSPRVRPKH